MKLALCKVMMQQMLFIKAIHKRQKSINFFTEYTEGRLQNKEQIIFYKFFSLSRNFR